MSIFHLKNLISEIIKESSGGGEVLGCVTTHKASICSTIYDASILGDIIFDNPNPNQKYPYKLLVPCVVGFVCVSPPKNPCWDAYEVKAIAGPGGLVYPIGYATSPSGRLISDRERMTPKAIDAWGNMSSKNKRKALRLDDYMHRHDPEDPNDYHTDDPADDCELRKEDYLNFAYESDGSEAGLYNGFVNTHNQEISDLKSSYGGHPLLEDFENLITQAGWDFFDLKTP